MISLSPPSFSRSRLLLFLLASCIAIPASAQTSQLAATPPMGWNSWNHFAEKVTVGDVRAAADALVSTGMRDAGYVYVNVDDTWQGQPHYHCVSFRSDRWFSDHCRRWKHVAMNLPLGNLDQLLGLFRDHEDRRMTGSSCGFQQT